MNEMKEKNEETYWYYSVRTIKRWIGTNININCVMRIEKTIFFCPKWSCCEMEKELNELPTDAQE